MTELDITYKIIVLKLLSRSDIALTNAQITDFFLETSTADYFTIQDAIAALTETANIIVTSTATQKFYQINEKGLETLSLFSDHLSKDVSSDIEQYFEKHGLAMKEENSLVSLFFPSEDGYICHLKKTDGNTVLIDISLSVHDRSLAQTICANWKVGADKVYDSLMDILVS